MTDTKNTLLLINQLLGKLFTLKGEPYSLKDHFMYLPLFLPNLPNFMTFKTGRQVGKTTTVAAASLFRAAAIPNYNILYILPLYDQAKRVSNLFIKPFMEESPLRQIFGKSRDQNIMTKTLPNRSSVTFSFAYPTVSRVRGLFMDQLNVDEVQDIDIKQLPIAAEVLAASKWNIQIASGTPKTSDNTLNILFEESSQAEWFIPCSHCTTNGFTTWNIPSVEFHTFKMIGPYRDDISEERPAIICHKCGKPLNARDGQWVHKYEDRKNYHAGYHIPQIILPLHNTDPQKWKLLLAKKEGQMASTMIDFFNEVLGETCDLDDALISMAHLKKAAVLEENKDEIAIRNARKYKFRVLGIDWGGGGQKGVSVTAVALACLNNSGVIDIIWGKKFPPSHDHESEAREIVRYYKLFEPHQIAHDFTGDGSLRETILAKKGIPGDRFFPIAYSGPSKDMACVKVPAKGARMRSFYRADKSRTLLYTCGCIRCGLIRFFKFDYVSAHNIGLLIDFTRLKEEKPKVLLD